MEAGLVTVAPAAAPAQGERRHAPTSLSVVCMTAGPGPRVCAILELLRPLAQEIIVAVDDRADPAVFADVATVADRLIAYPFAEPVDRPLPWLFAESRGEWMLTLDDDEVPSVALLDVLPALLADDRVVHYSFARRWVYPDASTYLDDAPWQPDYQLRLFRTDPRLIRFSDDLHLPIVPRGPGRFVPEPLLHLDTVLRGADARLAKAHRYESMRAGLRAGGRALNYGFYVPEARPDAQVKPLTEEERALVELVLAAERPRGPERAVRESATRQEIDAHWPSHRSPQSGELRLAADPPPFGAGEERAVDVVVRNTGAETWQWGRAALPTIRCASWWDDDDRASAVWTPLPAPIAPGESDVVPVHVVAPPDPGEHTLHLDLVHEGVRWLHCGVETRVRVRRRRRVAFLDVGDDVVRATLAADPDVEPVVLAAAPRGLGDGYAEAPSPWQYLAEDAPAGRLTFPATFAARAVRLLLAAHSRDPLPRGGREFLDTLRACERVVVGSSKPDALRRERWTRGVTTAAARLLRVPVTDAP